MASVTTFLAFSVWAWMFYHCFQHERGQVRLVWVLALILFNFLGAAAYFFARWTPQSLALIHLFVKRRRLKHKRQEAISNVRNIGKAHQFVQLGHIHQEMGNGDHALAAFQQALTREPNNVEALWGSASIELENKNLDQAFMLLRCLMEVRPDFRYGDASLAYGQVLYELGDFNLAQQHLEAHLQQWSHPEAALLMAQIQAHQQNMPGACEVLETMIANVQGAPAFHYRKHRRQVAQGQRLLKALNCRLS